MFAGFLISPIAWILMVYYAEVFTFDQMIQIVFSPAMITYILVATTLGLLFFKTKLSVIDIAIQNTQNSTAMDSTTLWITPCFTLCYTSLYSFYHNS